MMNFDFYTIGVYGLTAEQFFGRIKENNIDTFVDIRRRRAVRGSKYSFVNSIRLQSELKALGISYIHMLELSPTKELREIQRKADKSNKIAKRERGTLDFEFIIEYKKVLDSFNFTDFFNHLNQLKSKRVLFFCVEADPAACHRSIVVSKLANEYNSKIMNL